MEQSRRSKSGRPRWPPRRCGAAPRLILLWLVAFRQLVAPSAGQEQAAKDANVLFIGNSYMGRNNLLRLLEAMLDESDAYQPATFGQSSPSGHFFRQHYNDATLEGTELYSLLNGGTEWDWIVLQEQSQTGGSSTRDALREAFNLFDAVQQASPSSQKIFMMTWGRRNGDEENPNLYPDFLTMNGLLETGYRRYVSTTSTEEKKTLLAPVGLAFQHIYENELDENGMDPANDPSSLFYRLYDDDGGHPSVEGSYLAACVLYQTITGEDPRSLTFVPTGLDDKTRDTLQEAAYETVAAETGGETLAPVPSTPAPIVSEPSGPAEGILPVPVTLQPIVVPAPAAPRLTSAPSSSSAVSAPSPTPGNNAAATTVPSSLAQNTSTPKAPGLVTQPPVIADAPPTSIPSTISSNATNSSSPTISLVPNLASSHVPTFSLSPSTSSMPSKEPTILPTLSQFPSLIPTGVDELTSAPNFAQNNPSSSSRAAKPGIMGRRLTILPVIFMFLL